MRRTGEIRCGGMRMDLSPNGKCASYFALVMRWLHFLTLVTYYCMLLAIRSFVAQLQLELFRGSVHRGICLVYTQ